MWDNSGEDNVLFLAGGIAFNLMLAAFPVVLLCSRSAPRGCTLFAHGGHVEFRRAVFNFIDHLLPEHGHGSTSQIDQILVNLLRS